ncbi:MAG: hypothetical protein ACYSU7_15515 [Planctomycetota bacterium]|jgi:hypothetical protein
MAEKTGLEAELNVPDHVMVPSGVETLDIDVLATLRNDTEDDRVVHVPHGDHVHIWQLLDERRKEVARAPAPGKAKGLEAARSETIACGHAFAEPQTISLDAKKLKNGRCYTLRYVLWGEHTAEGRIHVSHAPAPAKPKAKAAGRKTRKKK